MNLMLIQESQIALSDFENLAAEPSDDTVCRQEVIASDAVLVGAELNPDHSTPRRGTAVSRLTFL